MVKFANKSKGRPSKRKTFKVKYKIEKRVKQHNKRVKKQARKLKGKGLKHKGIARSDYLPNMFPFKQQILDDARKSIPKGEQIEMKVLDQNEFGLINLENKCPYLPKPKDNLIKKYITNLEHAQSTVQVVLELLDSKNPQACIDKQFRIQCQKSNITIISVLTKIDTISPQNLQKSLAIAKQNSSKIVSFSCHHKHREQSLSDLYDALKETQGGYILVAGKTFTGKHSLISMIAKASGSYRQSPCQLQAFKLQNEFYLIDSPYKIKDTSGSPLFTVPNPILQESFQAQQQQLIRRLFVGQGKELPLFNKDDVLEHFSIQDFSTVSDFVSKVGKAGKHFGKGGSINTSSARTKIISGWFSGKLNHLLKY